MELNGKAAWVVGASSGIGAAVALALTEDGWTVVIAGRHRESLEAVVARGAAFAGTLEAIPTDVTNEESVRHLFDAAVETHGRVDLLLQAGPGGDDPDDGLAHVAVDGPQGLARVCVPRTTGRRSV